MQTTQVIPAAEANPIRVETGKLEVSRIYTSDNQKEGTVTAEIRQTITKHYPAKRVVNSLQDNIFSVEDFGFEEKNYDEKRVAWLDVPVGSTVETVAERLAQYQNANLYRILSNRPTISDAQAYAINSDDYPDMTLDRIADQQVVRYGEGHEDAGDLALDDFGKPQYRRIAFSSKGHEDIDTRNDKVEDYYASATIKEEMQEVSTPAEFHKVEGQMLS